METQKQKKGLNISTRSFLTAIAVIFVLMVLTYILTFLIPGGEYARLTDASGNTVIDTETGFSYVEGGIPFWKWIFSPLLLIGLGLADVNYGTWVKWSWKFQALNLVLTSLLLLFGMGIGY